MVASIYVSTKSSIRLGLSPRIIACNKKKYCHLNIFIKKIDVIKKIIPSFSYVKRTKQSCKPPCHSSLEAFFLSFIFWLSFAPRAKNHAT
jgi:hypothetical protein